MIAQVFNAFEDGFTKLYAQVFAIKSFPKV